MLIIMMIIKHIFERLKTKHFLSAVQKNIHHSWLQKDQQEEKGHCKQLRYKHIQSKYLKLLLYTTVTHMNMIKNYRTIHYTKTLQKLQNTMYNDYGTSHIHMLSLWIIKV